VGLAKNVFYSESESANKQINGVRRVEFDIDVDYRYIDTLRKKYCL